MADEAPLTDGFVDDDHRAAYIFSPDADAAAEAAVARPAKKRKLSKRQQHEPAGEEQARRLPEGRPGTFPRLFGGEENEACARLRQELFEKAWGGIEQRIQRVLKESNRSTLEEVASFLREASEKTDKIPAGFLVTGPNISSQELLFEQLSESLHGLVHGRLVRIRSAEAPNLKGTLRKIVTDIARQGPSESGGAEAQAVMDGQKFLDYDLDALVAFMKKDESKRVIVAFQDSEAFDSALLSDLIMIFNSVQDRVRFTLLFGIATSVDLFQTRLPKSTGRKLYGCQFDVDQSKAVLDSVFKCSVAHLESPLCIGPDLVQMLLERQQNQVAGIHEFTGALKYAYMCHFFANPLSIFLSPKGTLKEDLVQPQHVQAIRTLQSFNDSVERAMAAKKIGHAVALMDDGAYVVMVIQKEATQRRKWTYKLLRCLTLLEATGILKDDFATLYRNALRDGIDLEAGQATVLNSIKRMTPDEVISLAARMTEAVQHGNPALGLNGWQDEAGGLVALDMVETITALKAQAQEKGNVLRSKYTAQSRVLRTTVVAQKVQLSQDTATLSDEDKAFTEVVDSLVDRLGAVISCHPPDRIFLHELWLYDFQSPNKGVFVPSASDMWDRALASPHDYLGCDCCHGLRGGLSAKLPPTAILHHLYSEAGDLINVADLWTTFYGIVGRHEDDDDDNNNSNNAATEGGLDERTALALFYRSLAELKAMGCVKATKKKADHIAKVKWV